MAFYRPTTIRDYFEIARRVLMRGWIIFAVWVVVTGIIVVVALRQVDTYRSNAMILLQAGDVSDPGQTSVSVSINQRLRNLRPMILSRTSLESLIADFDLYPKMRRTAPMDNVIKRARKAVAIEVRNRDSFNVSFGHTDPRIAQVVTDQIAVKFIESSVSDAVRKARETVHQLQGFVDEYSNKIKGWDEKIRQFDTDHAGEINATGTNNPLQSLMDQLNATENRLTRLGDRQARLRTELAQLQTSQETPLVDPTVRRLQQQIVEAERRIKQLLDVYTGNHPDVVAAKSQLELLRAQVEQARESAAVSPTVNPNLRNLERELQDVDTERRMAKAEQRRIYRQIQRTRVEQGRSPQIVAQRNELLRRREAVSRTLDRYSTQLQDAKYRRKVLESQMGERFKLQDPANLPNAPDSTSKSLLIGAGAFMGLLAGLGVAFVLVYFDQTVYNQYELQRVTDLPVLVSIARFKELDSQAAPMTGLHSPQEARSLEDHPT